MIVLDSSALVDVVIDQPAREWVLDQITGEEVQAPSHQLAEVLSVLSRLVRAGELGAEEARDACREASTLPQDLVIPSEAHLERAFALRERIRVFDGLFVALAEDKGCALVTTDRRLSGASAPCEVRVP